MNPHRILRYSAYTAAALLAAAAAGCGGAARHAAQSAAPAAQIQQSNTVKPAKSSVGPWVAATSTSGFKYRIRALSRPKAITHYVNDVSADVVATPGKEFVSFTGEIANAMTDRPAETGRTEGSFELVFPKSDSAVFGALPTGPLNLVPGPGHCPPEYGNLAAGLCDLDMNLVTLVPDSPTSSAIPVGGTEMQTWVVGPLPASAPLDRLRLFFGDDLYVGAGSGRPAVSIPWAS